MLSAASLPMFSLLLVCRRPASRCTQVVMMLLHVQPLRLVMQRRVPVVLVHVLALV